MEAPAFVYWKQPGDIGGVDITDADLDPICNRADCRRLLLAGDRVCAAGHEQPHLVEETEGVVEELVTQLRRPRTCRGCGGDVDEITPGCRTCTGRDAVRRHRARREVA